ALAKATNMPVLFTPVGIPLEVETVEPIRAVDAPVIVQLKRAPIMAFQPTGEEVQLAAVVTPPPAQTEAASARSANLPSTASPLPLVALLGLMTLCGAFMIRTAARRLR